MRSLLSALDEVGPGTVIITRPNADPGNRAINGLIDGYLTRSPGALAFEALGHVRYLSLVKAADVVVGNSSSGIVEAPALGTPTVNVGSRQDGRVRSASIIDCPADATAIAQSIRAALAPDFQRTAEETARFGPYGDGHAAERILAGLQTADISQAALKKRFFDLPVEDA